MIDRNASGVKSFKMSRALIYVDSSSLFRQLATIGDKEVVYCIFGVGVLGRREPVD